MISPHHLGLADRWFAERGEATAFFSRMLPVVRTFMSVPAGIARMPLLRSLAYTFAGSFLWCAALATGGYKDIPTMPNIIAIARGLHMDYRTVARRAGYNLPDEPSYEN